MDSRELKNYIYENKYVEQLLESIGCHHIRFHNSSMDGYWSCANADGDNINAIIIYNNEYLSCTNYTRAMIKSDRRTDILDLVCYTKDISFPEALKFICQEIGISYYHDFDEDIPECFKVLELINSMGNSLSEEKDIPLKPISENILKYYKPFVNDMFAEDNIDYETQREFEVGYDEYTNRLTIPVRSELGDLVGVKGRYFDREVPSNENKYMYIEPCARAKILFGLYKTMPFIKQKGRVYVFESEKSVMQAWSYGYKNCVATGGKRISKQQFEMLMRLGVEIVWCFDKDVQKSEIETIDSSLYDGIDSAYIYDENNILSEHESPTDNPVKWVELVKNCIFKMR